MKNKRYLFITPLFLISHKMSPLKLIGHSILFMVICTMSLVSHADVPMAITNLDNRIDVTNYLDIIEDPEQQYTLKDIQSGRYDHLWQRNKNDYFIGENAASKYWFRLSLDWQGPREKDSVLYIDSQPNLLFRVGLSSLLPDGTNKVVNTGGLEHYASRDVTGQQYAFKLYLEPNKPQTLIGWLNNAEYGLPAQLPLYLVSEEQYDHIEDNFSLILAVFYAAMGALWIYNLCLFVTLRESVYGLYLLFLTCVVFICSSVDGSTMKWLWSDSPHINQRIAAVNGILLIVVYLDFIMRALNGANYWPWFKKVYRVAVYIGCATILHHLFTPALSFSTVINQVYSGVVMPLTLCLIFGGIQNKQPTAIYLLVAEFMTVLGGTCFMMMLQGFLPVNSFTFWGLHIGFGSEALLFSLALAARTRMAQQDSIKHLEGYESIYQNSVEGRFQFSFQHNQSKCNQSMLKMSGYHCAEQLISEQGMVQFVDQGARKQIMDRLLSDGVVSDNEVIITNQKTQEEMWVSLNMNMVKNNSDLPDLIEGTIIDISERKLKEDAEKEHQLSQAKNEAKSQFFASMSHEFRTPLTAVLGYTEIAKRSDITEPERIEHINTIEHSAQHMLELINDVLDLSKIEAQKLEVDLADTNLNQLVQDVHDFIWILADQKGIEFQLDYQYPLPKAFLTDATRLKQALINLCSNSVKFTDKGSVTLMISCDREQQELSFSVKDTGIGLEPTQCKKLFNAFSQAEKSTSRKYGGTGLGLHISKLIANKLGGDITVESQPGIGSKFTLSVNTGNLSDLEWSTSPNPKEGLIEGGVGHSEDETPTINNTESTHKNDEAIKVLIADDNAVNQKLIGFHVAHFGAIPISANDGLEAIALIIQNEVDIILMDIEMPRLDGIKAVKSLREMGFTTPIYALTGNVSPESIHQCINAGCDGHLAKPINTEKLKSIITHHCKTLSDLHSNIIPFEANGSNKK